MSNHLKGIPEWLNKDYMTTAMQKYLNENEIVCNCDVTPGSSQGDNYVCQIFRIRLVVRQGCIVRELHVIGKHNPGSSIMNELLKENINVHDNEVKFVSTILPKLNQINPISPKCFYIDNEKEIFFMEDLKQKGFVLPPKESFLNLNECLKVIQAYATLHAASYLEIQKNPQLKENFQTRLFSKKMPEMMDTFMINSFIGIENNIDKWDLTERQKNQLEKLKKKMFAEKYEICELNENNFNVLIHGDCWKNNMMFKYDKQVQQVRLLDFQLSNYNCFALDLHHFLNSSACNDVLYGKIDDILLYYYQEFLKIAPNVLDFSLDRVKKEFREKSFFGMIIAVTGRPFVVSKKPIDVDGVINGKTDTTVFDSQEMGEEVKQALNYYDFLL